MKRGGGGCGISRWAERVSVLFVFLLCDPPASPEYIPNCLDWRHKKWERKQNKGEYHRIHPAYALENMEVLTKVDTCNKTFETLLNPKQPTLALAFEGHVLEAGGEAGAYLRHA